MECWTKKYIIILNKHLITCSTSYEGSSYFISQHLAGLSYVNFPGNNFEDILNNLSLTTVIS